MISRLPPHWPGRIVLASTSPRRLAALEAMGVSVVVQPPAIDESRLPGETPLNYVARMATNKALAVGPQDLLTVAADTIIDLDGVPLGKPTSADDAGRQLTALAGRWHEVHTCIAVSAGQGADVAIETTRVEFRASRRSLVEWYVSTGEWQGKAGGYAIQGMGSLLIGGIQGSYDNVVGMPLGLLDDLFWSGVTHG